MTKLKVRDLMTTEVLTLRPDDTIKKAAIKLALDNMSGAPIVDAKYHLLGFLSGIRRTEWTDFSIIQWIPPSPWMTT